MTDYDERENALYEEISDLEGKVSDLRAKWIAARMENEFLKALAFRSGRLDRRIMDRLVSDLDERTVESARAELACFYGRPAGAPLDVFREQESAEVEVARGLAAALSDSQIDGMKGLASMSNLGKCAVSEENKKSLRAQLENKRSALGPALNYLKDK